MGAELTERLRRLAEEAPGPAGGIGPAGDLWARGRRRQRVRALSAVASAVLLLVLAGVGGGALWSRTAQPAPAGPPGTGMRLPDHLYTPGAWLAGADRPVGPLLAVVGGPRRSWLHSGSGLAGVSARTGAYRFLDLPGRAEETPALSPSGRWLAYWVLDERFLDRSVSSMQSCAGLAVYDTVSGATTPYEIVKPLGVSPHGLVWAGDTLWFDYSVIDEVREDGGSSSGGGSFAWTFSAAGPAIGEPKPFTGSDRIARSPSGVAPEGFTVGAAGGGYWVVANDRVSRSFFLDASVQPSPTVSPDGRTVAGIALPDPSVQDDVARSILVGTLRPLDETDRGDRVHLRAVPGVSVHQLLGWRDATKVVALTYAKAQGTRVDSIDISTGAVEPLTVYAGSNWAPGTIVAADAWSAPVVPAKEPRWPIDPRPVAAALVLLAAAVVLGSVRRRRSRERA